MSYVELDVSPPKRWRQFLPAWLSALLWVDGASRYDGFISYSLKADRNVAPVIQSIIHRFLCPWYKPRAKTIFRDLSSLPAGSNLETELFDRIDRSTHLIVLASPAARDSRGMQMEAMHWFSRPRDGQVLIVLTEGDAQSWDDIRRTLLPPALSDGLAAEPLWASVRDRRPAIIANPGSLTLREELIEDVHQILLRFYPGMDWGQLRGEERALRRRTIRIVVLMMSLFLCLAVAATAFGWYALNQQHLAESRQLAAQSQLMASYDPAQALALAMAAAARTPSEEAQAALGGVIEAPLVRLVLLHDGPVNAIVFASDRTTVATASDDKTVRLWDTASGTLKRTFSHDGKVLSVALTSDAGRVAAGADNGTVKVWDIESEQLVFTREGAPDPNNSDNQRPRATQVSFSPDNTRILAIYDNGDATFWDGAGTKIDAFTICEDSSAHAAFSPDSRLLAIWGSGCDVSEIRDAHTAKHVSTVGWPLTRKEAREQQGSSPIRGVERVLFTPDSRSVVLMEWQGQAGLWDARKGKLIRKFGSDFPAELKHAAFSADGKAFFTANSDSSITRWDAANMRPKESGTGHTKVIFSASLVAQDKRIVTASRDNSVRLWNAGDLSEPPLILGGGPATLKTAAASPDGETIATTDGGQTVQIWDVKKTHPLLALDAGKHVNLAAFLGNSGEATTCAKGGTCSFWNGRTANGLPATGGQRSSMDFRAISGDGQRLAFVGDHSENRRVEIWAPSGTLPIAQVATCRGDPVFSTDLTRMVCFDREDKTANVFDLGADVQSRQLVGHDEAIRKAAFTGDGLRIVTVADDKTARVWDAASGKPVARLPHDETVHAAEFTPDGSGVMTTDFKNVVRRWDWALSKVQYQLDQDSRSDSLVFSSDGMFGLQISNSGREHAATLFDLKTGKSFGRLEMPHGPDDYFTGQSFSSDSRRILIASRDRTARLWNAKTGALETVLIGHTGRISDARFSPDGRYVATASQDGTVRLWSAATGHSLITFKPGGDVASLVFSPDGRKLLIANEGASVYATDVLDLLSWAGSLAPRHVNTNPAGASTHRQR